jgi:chemotaxis protein MotB
VTFVRFEVEKGSAKNSMYSNSNGDRKAPSHGQSAPRPGVSLANTVAAAPPQIANDDGNWWIITLSDLTLLLLGFFVLWYVTEQKKPVAPQPPAVTTQIAEQSAPPVATPVQTGIKPEEWKEFEDQMKSVIGEAGLSKDVTIEFAQNEILLSLKDTLPFDSGKADLRPQAFPVLEKVVGMLVGHPALALEISGHTDSVPIATAAFPSNWELSSARASRVARYLIEQGIDPSRIAVQGYANQRPRTSNFDATSREANRRVELRFYRSSTDKPLPEDRTATVSAD